MGKGRGKLNEEVKMNGKNPLPIDKKATVIDNAELTPGTPCGKIALRLQSKRKKKTPLKQDNENILDDINKNNKKLPLSFFKGGHALSTA